MTKKELYDLAAENFKSKEENNNIPKHQFNKIIDSFFETLVDSVLKIAKETPAEQLKDQKVSVEIGHFFIALSKERTGRNPRTGEEIKIPASKSLKFKVSKVVKNQLNNN